MSQARRLKKGLLWKSGVVCLVVALSSQFAVSAWGGDWTQFRGPGGGGIAEATNLPTAWDAQKNIVWKTELPGLGTSSPVILGTRIYLTCYSGYGESIKKPGDMQDLMRHLVCLDRQSGKILWTKDFTPKLPESKYRSGNDSRHGYASSTLATDGKRLYAFFGISGVYGFDLDGNTLWHTDVGSGTHGWGSGTSPLLYKNLVIVNASIESESLVALNKDSGKIVWRTPDIKRCWSSPLLVQVGDKQELVLNAPHKLIGLDPDTGKQLWHCNGIPDGYICPTGITHGDVVYAIGGRKNTAIAVRAGGRGDVTQTHVLWTTDRGSNVSSPVYLDGYLYWCHESRGRAYCLDAKTGKIVYEESLTPRPGLIYSSFTAADGKLYAPSQEKGTYVVAAKPEFQQLAVNRFQDDASRTNGSIAVSNNQLIMRTDKAIYCIGCAQLTSEMPKRDVTAISESLITEMKAYFGENQGLIQHTVAVYGYAKQIREAEGGDILTARAAAIYHDIGIPEAKRVHGSSRGKYQEIEGPPIARRILSHLNLDQDRIDHVCHIIANHHTAHDKETVDTIEFKIIWDADALVNLRRRRANTSKERFSEIINDTFRTRKGLEIAKELYLSDASS